jgi:hypothetical protein
LIADVALALGLILVAIGTIYLAFHDEPAPGAARTDTRRTTSAMLRVDPVVDQGEAMALPCLCLFSARRR